MRRCARPPATTCSYARLKYFVKKQRNPHPEEARSAVSKDGPRAPMVRAEGALLTMRTNKLQHRQAARLRTARKGVVDRFDLACAQRQLPRHCIVGGVL